ncbi:MAG: methionine adenosyltransferase [Deltaproteobacteria bacterium]|jgi:S-adenosylmethionine synthetase|nr:methionine adenosyltransferase [Deltaproteobacteria bacterium]
MKTDFIFTSESATGGHPDKLCDQISDAIVDRFLDHDPLAKIRAECAVSTAVLFLAARFASSATVDIAQVARKVIKKAGYEHEDFNSTTCSILTSLKELPLSDSRCFDERDLSDQEMDRIHVKQQGTFFGYACRQTPSLMPMPIMLAHKLAMRIDSVRQQKLIPYLAPDGKTQVGIEYRDRKPARIYSVGVAVTQLRSSMQTARKISDDIRQAVIEPVFKDEPLRPDEETKLFINPEGVTMLGGPSVHSGLTGRKNGVDTYGEYSRYSGSALSGKDPMRIDRVGVYAARYAAKNIVAAHLADECEVQLTYSIGSSRPVSVQVDTFDTGKVSDRQIADFIKKHFDFRLAAIVREFDLRRLPGRMKGDFYRRLAVYGHVGRTDLDLPWERIDKVSCLASD